MGGTGAHHPKRRPTEPGLINRDMFQRSEQLPGKAPNIVIDVPNLDQVLRKIEAAGEKTVTENMPVADMGFAAHLTDTDGNLIRLWDTA